MNLTKLVPNIKIGSCWSTSMVPSEMAGLLDIGCDIGCQAGGYPVPADHLKQTGDDARRSLENPYNRRESPLSKWSLDDFCRGCLVLA